MKKCGKCLEEKQYESFSKNIRTNDGYHRWCKKCDSERHKRKAAENLKNRVEVEEKLCLKCKENKKIGDFHKDNSQLDGYRIICKLCAVSESITWNKKNRDRINERARYRYQNDIEFNNRKKEKNKKYWNNNKEKCGRYKRNYENINRERINKQRVEYRKNNEEKVKERERRYRRKYRNSDPIIKIRENISSQIHKAVKNLKTFTILKMLPYTMKQLKIHLEFLFEPWMNWENHGKYDPNRKTWQIDHIIPQSLLPYDSPDHLNFQKCWALENLRPLESIANIKKGNKLILKEYYDGV